MSHTAENDAPLADVPFIKAPMPSRRDFPPAKQYDWHEFTEDVNDASMCVCGVPALTHDAIFPPGSTKEDS